MKENAIPEKQSVDLCRAAGHDAADANADTDTTIPPPTHFERDLARVLKGVAGTFAAISIAFVLLMLAAKWLYHNC